MKSFQLYFVNVFCLFISEFQCYIRYRKPLPRKFRQAYCAYCVLSRNVYPLHYTAIWRKVVGKKMCTRQPRKVIWDMINTLFLTTVAVEPTLVTFHQDSRTHVRGLSCHSFKFLQRTGQTKPPTIPFGIVACTFSYNLSQNRCIWKKTVMHINKRRTVEDTKRA